MRKDEAGWMTTSEVARYCGVAASTVIAWDRDGKLRAKERTQGGMRLFLLADVRAFVKKRGKGFPRVRGEG